MATGLLRFQLEVSDALFTSVPVISEVSLVDTTSPLITILGDNPLTAEIEDPYLDPWATANDLVDGNVEVSATASEVSPGVYEVVYSASDSSSNTATATRTVFFVDTNPPVITINGDNPLNHPAGQPYIDPWAEAVDGVEGHVPVSATSSEVSPGVFEVVYSASDSSGNTATAIRVINIVP